MQHRQPDPGKTAFPFAVHYLPQTALPGFFAEARNVLGVIGFGAEPPDFPPGCPYVSAPLRPISGGAQFEIWTAANKLRPAAAGAVKGVYNDEIAFGAVILSAQAPLESAVELAYRDIFDFLQQTGHQAIRFWNYPVAITADDNGMERYRRFNIGRHRAFTSRLSQKLPPAATAVGGHEGHSVIYFLAAREPALPVENPRQVSAYAYPPIYGPRSPSFSRASVYTQNAASCLFVSGTASITGHETRHAGNLAAQIAETAENLRAVITASGDTAPTHGEWALKIYLQDPASQPMVAPIADAIFGPSAPRIYLHGDICRSELLVEIEAFRQF